LSEIQLSKLLLGFHQRIKRVKGRGIGRGPEFNENGNFSWHYAQLEPPLKIHSIKNAFSDPLKRHSNSIRTSTGYLVATVNFSAFLSARRADRGHASIKEIAGCIFLLLLFL
jgi:hypothetical protein